jgi:hypothetical protein
MQPFKITCVTCRAGLTVKNESLVGQIIACPRCGSMVQVIAPAAPATTSTMPAAAAAAMIATPAAPSFADVDAAAPQAPAPPPALSEVAPATTFDDAAAALDAPVGA